MQLFPVHLSLIGIKLKQKKLTVEMPSGLSSSSGLHQGRDNAILQLIPFLQSADASLQHIRAQPAFQTFAAGENLSSILIVASSPNTPVALLRPFKMALKTKK